MLGELVVGRESRGVGRLCDLAIDNLLERVNALSVNPEGVHEMHLVG